MVYKCPKGHQSTDSDYCSECGALIGQSKLSNKELELNSESKLSSSVGTCSQEICPDCGTPRTLDARFCEVCRHDFLDNKTGVAEAIVASQKDNSQAIEIEVKEQPKEAKNVVEKEALAACQKLNIVISVDKDRVSAREIESSIKPDSVDRAFPLDLDENLLGRRSVSKNIYPEIEINDPGVSHRHLKFIKQPDGSFAVLELGSANGTQLNGIELEAGVNTPIKAGDEFAVGIWTLLKIETR